MTTDPLLLGIDVGTSSAKTVLMTPAGQVIGSASIGYSLWKPSTGHVEQFAPDWWSAVVLATQDLLAKTGVKPEQVRGVGASGQGCAVTLIDDSGNVLRPAITWQDSRSHLQCVRLSHMSPRVLELNGKELAAYNADPVFMWLVENDPQIVEDAHTSLTTTGYINYMLTGRAVLNRSDASILFAYNLYNNQWSQELIDVFNVPEKLYPEIAACSEIIGTLQSEAADLLGLPVGIPVVAGGEDTSSAGLAIGGFEDGQVLLSLGTAGTIYLVRENITTHPKLLTFLHVVDGLALMGGSTIAFGGAMDWCRSFLGQTAKTHAEVASLAEDSNPGANNLLFLPYLNGELQPINNGHAQGVFLGMNFRTTTADAVRAVMEGAVYALAHNLQLATQDGTVVNEVRATGGPTRNELWCQIISDVLGLPLKIQPTSAGAPAGNALLAAKGIGLIENLSDVDLFDTPETQTFEPGMKNHRMYQELLEIYTSLFPVLEPQFEALSEVSDHAS